MLNPQNVVALSAYQNQAPHLDHISNQPALPDNPDQQPAGVHIPGGYSHTYYLLSGTSMAAAVRGAAADLLQAAPSLTPDQVKILLMETASKTFPYSSTVIDQSSGQIYTSYYDIFTVGAGYMDLAAAMAAVKQVPADVTALSPVANYDGSTGDVELSFDPSSIFANKAIWGSSVLTASKAIWGSQVVWGSSADSAQKAIWGSSAIWSTKAIWGSSTKNTAESTSLAGEP